MNERLGVWLVFYTKSRAEKKTEELLRKNGYEPYLPLQRVLRQWSDRKKKVDVPLFNSYIFVRDYEYNIPKILQIPGIVWNIRHNDRPAILRDKDMEVIKRFIETGLLIETGAPEDLQPGDPVKLLDGPLRGLTGIIDSEYNPTKFSVVIDSLDKTLTVSIEKVLVRKIN